MSCDPSRKDVQSLAFSVPVRSRGWDPALGPDQRSCLSTATRGRQKQKSVRCALVVVGGGAEWARLPQSPERWAGLRGPGAPVWTLSPAVTRPLSLCSKPLRHQERVERSPRAPSRSVLPSPASVERHSLPNPGCRSASSARRGMPRGMGAGTDHLVPATLRSKIIYH